LDRLQATLDAIDAANAEDPNQVSIRGEVRPKELAHAALASQWLERLEPGASDALRIAARAHHIRRWEIPRADYPEGKAGYHRWRRELQQRHADHVGRILGDLGWNDETRDRVQAIVRKQGLGRDPEVQAFEDALCLVFLETQFGELRARLADDAKLEDVTRKTAAKMSEAALGCVHELPLSEDDLSLIERALQS
jgi:hypothetical protein